MHILPLNKHEINKSENAKILLRTKHRTRQINLLQNY